MGTWFQVAKDLLSPMENGNCAQTRYYPNEDGTIRIQNSQFNN